jgi:hypothetical protein
LVRCIAEQADPVPSIQALAREIAGATHLKTKEG